MHLQNLSATGTECTITEPMYTTYMYRLYEYIRYQQPEWNYARKDYEHAQCHSRALSAAQWIVDQRFDCLCCEPFALGRRCYCQNTPRNRNSPPRCWSTCFRRAAGEIAPTLQHTQGCYSSKVHLSSTIDKVSHCDQSDILTVWRNSTIFTCRAVATELSNGGGQKSQ